MNLKHLFRTHGAGVIFALASGFMMIAPQLAFIHNLGTAYHGVYMLGTDAETHYLSRMEELYDGHLWGNPFLAEFKEKQYSLIFTPAELLLAVPGYILSIGIANLNLFYKFL